MYCLWDWDCIIGILERYLDFDEKIIFPVPSQTQLIYNMTFEEMLKFVLKSDILQMFN